MQDMHITVFANDCVLYLRGNDWNALHDKLQNNLNHFVNWSRKNSLCLNGKKSPAMIVRTRNLLSKLKDVVPFEILGTNMKHVKQHNYLGVILDAEISLIPLCKSVDKRVIDKVFMLRKIKGHLTYHAALQVYKQLAVPMFDYSGLLLISCKQNKAYIPLRHKTTSVGDLRWVTPSTR